MKDTDVPPPPASCSTLRSLSERHGKFKCRTLTWSYPSGSCLRSADRVTFSADWDAGLGAFDQERFNQRALASSKRR
jgi:hypothetical protein